MFKFSDIPPYKEQGCCDSGCDCATSNSKSTRPCPECDNLGECVSNLTVCSLTKKEFKSDIERKGSDDFNICMTPECKTVYYNDKRTIKTNELKTPFHVKNDSEMHMVCYCLKIDKNDIIDAVHNRKLTGMKDIMKAIRSEPPCVCEKNNPTGLCCDEAFNDIIKEAIQSYNK